MPRIKIGEAKLFFDVYGSKLNIGQTEVKEKPTLLVLHGAHGALDHTLYVEFWSKFSDIAQVIFLDQRGCGRSDARTSVEWNLHDWGQDVHDFCEALEIKKPIVAGVSMGGHVICEYATRYPEHPGAVIFCHTEAKIDVELIAEKYAELGSQEAAHIARKNFTDPTPETVKAYQEKCMPLFGRVGYSPAEIKRCQQHPEVFEHYCKHELKNFDYRDKLQKIHCPTLFMVGEKSPGHPPKSAEAMAAKIDKRWVTYHEFKNAGAPVYKDSPEESEAVVRKFILGLPAI